MMLTNFRDVERRDHPLYICQRILKIDFKFCSPLVSTVLAEYVFEEIYITRGIIKFVDDPNINADQFMTKINHP